MQTTVEEVNPADVLAEFFPELAQQLGAQVAQPEPEQPVQDTEPTIDAESEVPLQLPPPAFGYDPRPIVAHQRVGAFEFRVIETNARKHGPLKLNAVDYEIQVIKHNDTQVMFRDMQYVMRSMFDELIDRLREVYDPSTHRGQITIYHNGDGDASCNRRVGTHLRLLNELHSDEIFDAIEVALNSNEGLALDEGFRVSAMIVEDRGGDGPVKVTKVRSSYQSGRMFVTSIAVDRLRKNSVVTVKGCNVEALSSEDPVAREHAQAQHQFNLCMARAIVLGREQYIFDNNENWCDESNRWIQCTDRTPEQEAMMKNHLIRLKRARDNQDQSNQTRLARELHIKAGVPFRLCVNTDAQRFADVIHMQIKIIENRVKTFETLPARDERIYILLSNGHYDLLKSPGAWLGTRYYCPQCDVGFNYKEGHNCAGNCFKCDLPVCVPGIRRRCDDCNQWCESQDCYDSHCLREVCSKSWRCLACGRKFWTRELTKDDHNCDEYKCVSCKEYVKEGHLCMMQQKKLKKHCKQIYFFDFETMLNAEQQHEVVFCVFQDEEGEETVFSAAEFGRKTLQKVGEWVFSPKHDKAT
ncbi:MAG TPA: hypothetical protein VM260_09590, partial [Pirellula sp.]|nr:hypothetical protein [Pirellula sp.]